MTQPQKKKIFITVKTYPALSAKYDELVCTAGITNEGKWIRIYPIPFRKLKWENQYKKYQWIELDVVKNTTDFRPESYKPINRGQSITVGQKVNNWTDKKKIIFQKEVVFTNITTLIKQAKDRKTGTSLAIFKPKEIVNFKIQPIERNWNAEKIEKIKEASLQFDLFNSDKPYEIFQKVKKLPYKFSYVFKDETERQSTLMIEDWEIGALYWNCLRREQDENKAVQKVKQKYFDQFKKKDLYLFLGTTLKYQFRALNPFIIIGIFYPPKNDQLAL